jgi:hypothetical protein
VPQGEQGSLFDLPPGTPDAPELDGLSAARRRTLRQRMMLERGLHPLSAVQTAGKIQLHPQAAPAGDREAPGRRCGSCVFRRQVAWRDYSQPKCWYGLAQLDAASMYLEQLPRVAHSASSDVRAWWPACTEHEFGDPAVSPDAARWTPERE